MSTAYSPSNVSGGVNTQTTINANWTAGTDTLTGKAVVELLQYCKNLEAIINGLQAAVISHGLMADA